MKSRSVWRMALAFVAALSILLMVNFSNWHSKPQRSDARVAASVSPKLATSDLIATSAASITAQGAQNATRLAPPSPPTIRDRVPEREVIASTWKMETNAPMAAFRHWTERYLAAAPNQRSALLAEGVKLATVRRDALSELIQKDPRRALADAVPMAVRKQLPDEVLVLLEERVGAFGNLTRVYPYPPDPKKPWFDYTQVDGKAYTAHRYGQRAVLAALKNASLIGIAVGNELVLADSPVRMLEVGETVEGQVINEFCPVSGNTVTSTGQGRVTDGDEAPIQVGNQLLGTCTPEHAVKIESALHCMEVGAEATAVSGGVNIKAIQEQLKKQHIMAYGGAPGTAWPGQPPVNITHGPKKVIVYRVQMQNWSAFPPEYTSNYCHTVMKGFSCTECWGNPTRTVANQMWDFSWGKMEFAQVDVTPVMQLPKTRDEYIANYWGPVLDDSRAAAAALGYDVNSYQFQVIVHSGLDWGGACGWGGNGVVWVNQCYGAGLLEHELGHGVWLPHANGWAISDGNPWSPGRVHMEYLDPSDPMGNGNWSPANHFNSFYKYFLGWLPATAVINVTSNSVYRLYQYDDLYANTNNPMALVFPHDAVSSYWVSFRGNSPAGNYANSAQILEVRNGATDTHLLDFNDPNSDNDNGGLNVGQIYNDPVANLRIRTVGIGGTAPNRYLDFEVIFNQAMGAQLAFNETSGTTASDSSAHDWNGSLVNGPTWTTGKFGNAVNLEGVNDHVSLPNGVISRLNDFTIAAWVRPDTISTWSRIFDFGTGTDFYMFLSPRAGNGLLRYAITQTSSGGEQVIDGLAAMLPGVWTHVAVTLSGTTGLLYVNGAAVGTNSNMTLKPSSLGYTAQNYIGKSQWADPYFDGRVDDFHIFDRALSVAELQSLTGNAAPPTPTNLSAIAGVEQVKLSWNNSVGATNYNVKRATVSGGPYSTIGSSASPTFTDWSALNGTIYYYVVSAVNAAGESTNSAQVTTRPNELVAHWRFDESLGTSASDASGNSNSATLQIGATWTGGISNNAVLLNGTSSSYVGLPAGVVSTLNDFTIATWVYVNANGTWARLFDIGTGTSANMFLTPASGGNTVRYAITVSGGGGEQQINSASVLSPGAWHHLAVTLSGARGTLYIDGVAAGSNGGMTLKPSSLGSTTQNYIGKSQYADPILNGKVDDFRIYRRALSSTEVAALFNGQPLPPHINVPNLGFESPSVGMFQYNPSGGSWTFATQSGNNGSGIAANESTFAGSNPNAPEGSQVAFLQGIATISQTVSNLVPGTNYIVTFWAAQRATFQNGGQTWNLKLDNTVIGSYTPPPTATNYLDYTAGFTATNTAHTLSFVGTDLPGGDNTVLLDNVRIAPAAPPSIPIGLVASPGNNQVVLSWAAAPGAVSYNVKRSTTNGGPYNIISSPTTTSYTDTTAVNNATYYYVVSAVNATGESTNSIQVSATPFLPEKLNGTIIGSAGSWGGAGNTTSNVFDNNLTTYYDAVNGTGDWAGLDLGTNRVITQIKYCPRSGWASRMVGGQFQGANVANFGSGVVALFTIGATPTEGVLTTQLISVPNSFRYVRYLGPANGFCNVAEVEFYKAAALPAAPASLTATAGDSQVGLSWNASAGATSYNVKRATVNGGPYASVAGGLAATNFTNTNLLNGTMYYFVVTATNAAGESASSIQIEARPTSTAPVNVSISPSADAFNIAWPADHTGWRLQTQTNGLSPTNWFDLTGATATNLMFVPVNTVDGSVFFRLVYP